MSARLLTVKIKSLKYSDPAFRGVNWDITQSVTIHVHTVQVITPNLLFKTLEEYTEAFDYLSDYFGNMAIKVDILGGEPTLFKPWYELMNRLVKETLFQSYY